MTDCVEVMVASDNNGELSVWNPAVGTKLMTYKNGGGTGNNALAFIKGDYVISGDSNRPLINMWNLNSQEPNSTLRMVVGNRVNALAVSNCGVYCIAGLENKIYIWHLQSGRLLNIVAKHYQDITNIKFVDDGHHFVTTGKDGCVFVWRLSRIIPQSRATGFIFTTNTYNEPVYDLSSCSLPVTDIHVGCKGMKARIFTVSLDQTCKIHSLNDGKLLLSVSFGHALTSVTVNSIESVVYVGTSDGQILQFSLNPLPRTLEYHISDNDANVVLKEHVGAVTCLSTSSDCKLLLSGGNDQNLRIWDTKTSQLLHVIPMKGEITNAFFSKSKVNMFKNEFKPSMVMKKFQPCISSNIEPINVLAKEKFNPSKYTLLNNEDVDGVANEISSDNNNEEAMKKIKQLAASNKMLYELAIGEIMKNPMKKCTEQKDESKVSNGSVQTVEISQFKKNKNKKRRFNSSF